MLQFNFKIADITGSLNTAADFLFTLEIKGTAIIRLKVRKNIQTTPIEVTTFFPHVADVEQFFFTKLEYENDPDKQIFQ